MLRNRLVVGIKDQELSEKLQLDPDLTLEKAKKIIQPKEAVKEQHHQLNGDRKKDSSLEEVKQLCWQKKPQSRARDKRGGASGKHKGSLPDTMCTRCGKHKHYRGEKCPAADAVCHRCNKKGHFGAQCFTKKPTSLSANEVSLDRAYLDTVGKGGWMTTVTLCGMQISLSLIQVQKLLQCLRKPSRPYQKWY